MKSKILAGLVACGLTLQGCGLDKVEVPTALIGPSELGISLQMLALSRRRARGRHPDRGDPGGGARPERQIRGGARRSSSPSPTRPARTAEIGTLTSATGARVFGSTTINTNANGDRPGRSTPRRSAATSPRTPGSSSARVRWAPMRNGASVHDASDRVAVRRAASLPSGRRRVLRPVRSSERRTTRSRRREPSSGSPLPPRPPVRLHRSLRVVLRRRDELGRRRGDHRRAAPLPARGRL